MMVEQNAIILAIVSIGSGFIGGWIILYIAFGICRRQGGRASASKGPYSAKQYPGSQDLAWPNKTIGKASVDSASQSHDYHSQDAYYIEQEHWWQQRKLEPQDSLPKAILSSAHRAGSGTSSQPLLVGYTPTRGSSTQYAWTDASSLRHHLLSLERNDASRKLPSACLDNVSSQQLNEIVVVSEEHSAQQQQILPQIVEGSEDSPINTQRTNSRSNSVPNLLMDHQSPPKSFSLASTSTATPSPTVGPIDNTPPTPLGTLRGSTGTAPLRVGVNGTRAELLGEVSSDPVLVLHAQQLKEQDSGSIEQVRQKVRSTAEAGVSGVHGKAWWTKYVYPRSTSARSTHTPASHMDGWLQVDAIRAAWRGLQSARSAQPAASDSAPKLATLAEVLGASEESSSGAARAGGGGQQHNQWNKVGIRNYPGKYTVLETSPDSYDPVDIWKRNQGGLGSTNYDGTDPIRSQSARGSENENVSVSQHHITRASFIRHVKSQSHPPPWTGMNKTFQKGATISGYNKEQLTLIGQDSVASSQASLAVNPLALESVPIGLGLAAGGGEGDQQSPRSQALWWDAVQQEELDQEIVKFEQSYSINNMGKGRVSAGLGGSVGVGSEQTKGNKVSVGQQTSGPSRDDSAASVGGVLGSSSVASREVQATSTSIVNIARQAKAASCGVQTQDDGQPQLRSSQSYTTPRDDQDNVPQLRSGGSYTGQGANHTHDSQLAQTDSFAYLSRRSLQDFKERQSGLALDDGTGAMSSNGAAGVDDCQKSSPSGTSQGSAREVLPWLPPPAQLEQIAFGWEGDGQAQSQGANSATQRQATLFPHTFPHGGQAPLSVQTAEDTSIANGSVTSGEVEFHQAAKSGGAVRSRDTEGSVVSDEELLERLLHEPSNKQPRLCYGSDGDADEDVAPLQRASSLDNIQVQEQQPPVLYHDGPYHDDQYQDTHVTDPSQVHYPHRSEQPHAITSPFSQPHALPTAAYTQAMSRAPHSSITQQFSLPLALYTDDPSAERPRDHEQFDLPRHHSAWSPGADEELLWMDTVLPDQLDLPPPGEGMTPENTSLGTGDQQGHGIGYDRDMVKHESEGGTWGGVWGSGMGVRGRDVSPPGSCLSLVSGDLGSIPEEAGADEDDLLGSPGQSRDSGERSRSGRVVVGETVDGEEVVGKGRVALGQRNIARDPGMEGEYQAVKELLQKTGFVDYNGVEDGQGDSKESVIGFQGQ